MKAHVMRSALCLSLFFAVGCGGTSPGNEPPLDLGSGAVPEPVNFKPPAPWSTLTDGFGGARNHKGIDFGIGSSTQILAIARGEVVDRQQEDCHGKYIVIRHPNGVYSMYAHMDTINVTVGDTVGLQHELGTPGTTGSPNCVNGVHLHLSMKHSWNGEASWNTDGFFDPEEYIKSHQ